MEPLPFCTFLSDVIYSQKLNWMKKNKTDQPFSPSWTFNVLLEVWERETAYVRKQQLSNKVVNAWRLHGWVHYVQRAARPSVSPALSEMQSGEVLKCWVVGWTWSLSLGPVTSSSALQDYDDVQWLALQQEEGCGFLLSWPLCVEFNIHWLPSHCRSI